MNLFIFFTIFAYIGLSNADNFVFDGQISYRQFDLSTDFEKLNLNSLLQYGLMSNKTKLSNNTCPMYKTIERINQAWMNFTANEKAEIRDYIVDVSIKEIRTKKTFFAALDIEWHYTAKSTVGYCTQETSNQEQKLIKDNKSCKSGAKTMKCQIKIEERWSKNGTALVLIKLKSTVCPPPKLEVRSSTTKMPKSFFGGGGLEALKGKFNGGKKAKNDATVTPTTQASKKNGIGKSIFKMFHSN